MSEEFKKLTYRWKDRELKLSNGPARGMLLVRHDDGTTVGIVVPLHVFDALWNHLLMEVKEEPLMSEEEDA